MRGHTTRGAGRAWAGLLAFGSLALALTMGASGCYSPDTTAVLYQCDRGRCPEPLFCNDGKYCTETLKGCKSTGGINLSPTMLVCPGADNTCAGEYTATCPADVQGKPADQVTPLCSKLSASECRVCCRAAPATS